MKRKPATPRSKVKSAIRILWLRSRERAAALKRDKYTCQACGAKQSKARGKEVSIEVHHLTLVKWEEIIDLIIDRILCKVDNLVTLCKACHAEVTQSQYKTPSNIPLKSARMRSKGHKSIKGG